MQNEKDYVGKRFRMLVVIKKAPRSRHGAIAWWCRCDCGKKHVYAVGAYLRNGDTGSCGCSTGSFIAKANTTHGMARTRVYKVWRAMMDRCYNPKIVSYKYCGARGIRVCKRWHKFENFYADMGPRPKSLTLERSNNNKGYSKSNCVWATYAEQARNKRSNRRLRYKGKEQTLSQWATKLGHPPLRIWQRLSKGWSVKEALETPKVSREWAWNRKKKV